MKGRTVHQVSLVDNYHVAADGVFAAIDAALVKHLLHAERHEYGGAFGGKRSQRIYFAYAVWQNGIQPFELLILKRRELA